MYLVTSRPYTSNLYYIYFLNRFHVLVQCTLPLTRLIWTRSSLTVTSVLDRERLQTATDDRFSRQHTPGIHLSINDQGQALGSILTFQVPFRNLPIVIRHQIMTDCDRWTDR